MVETGSFSLSAGMRRLTLLLLFVGLAACARHTAFEEWRAAANDRSGERVDHNVWQRVLDRYVDAGDDGINRVHYAALKARGMPLLQDYLRQMASIDPLRLSGDAQMAYWINLYNALTLKVVADAYPTASILDIGARGPGKGPWDDPVVTVSGATLTLNDIEHEILRKFWQEPRIHFAVNCASIGCPNLARTAYRGATLERQLATAARAFLDSPRAVRLDGEILHLSSLFDWYAADFGSDALAVRTTLATYASPQTAVLLRAHRGRVRFHYDWSLNDATD